MECAPVRQSSAASIERDRPGCVRHLALRAATRSRCADPARPAAQRLRVSAPLPALACCIASQHTALHCIGLHCIGRRGPAEHAHRSTPQHTAAHRSTPQHIKTHSARCTHHATPTALPPPRP
eukprot:3912089-Rhodomonas_salina.1